MKVVYSTSAAGRNFCVDMSRLKGHRVQVCSSSCQACPHCYNKKDGTTKRRGIIMCANDISLILPEPQFPAKDVR